MPFELDQSKYKPIDFKDAFTRPGTSFPQDAVAAEKARAEFQKIFEDLVESVKSEQQKDGPSRSHKDATQTEESSSKDESFDDMLKKLTFDFDARNSQQESTDPLRASTSPRSPEDGTQSRNSLEDLEKQMKSRPVVSLVGLSRRDRLRHKSLFPSRGEKANSIFKRLGHLAWYQSHSAGHLG